MNNTPVRDPAEVEATALARLDTGYRQLTDQLRSQSDYITTSEAEARVRWLDQWAEWFSAFGDEADYCTAAGRPELRQRLAPILSDLNGAIAIYLEKLQDQAREYQQRTAQINDEASRYALATVSAVIDNNRRVQAGLQEQRMRLLRNECPACGVPMLPGGYHPACVGVIGARLHA